MKKLGLIGGTGPESTIPYYRNIVFGVKHKVGKEYFPNITIESLNVFEVLNKCAIGDYMGLAEYMAAGISCLAAAGCDFAAFTGITPHIVFDEVQKKSAIPLVSMIDTTCNKAKCCQYKKIGLLGTKATMTGSFFQKPFEASGIEIITPECFAMEYINDKISRELENGIVLDDTRQQFIHIIEDMVDNDSIDAVVLGCTEIPLLFQSTNLPIPVLDAMEIHMETLIDMILK
ncbi:amino acid racemase [Megasphaera paucivorans]|uniref:Aspartate racemase n=1 Tax=Megasphaera paucivorans TaxID=349095 RepID=A0A1G9RNQ1_9FIRM|nr:amino acid racemase [Megasphaera paucivorans]SDM24761.1 aspartate racemase [Megasphaera paucivorans]